MPRPPGPRAGDGVLRIVSCAAARPVKRLHRIAEALAYADVPVRWTHIGDGPELPRLRALAERLPAHVAVDLAGAVAPPEVPRRYQAHPYDLFLNVSESEGVPVSIMEAMAAGIPALATDVGGTRELVTPDAGRLVPADVSPAALWRAISAFSREDAAVIDAMRAASAEAIRCRYDIRANAGRVAQALLALPVAA
ncbi:MAG: glycosyltransferase [Sphingomonas sp.]